MGTRELLVLLVAAVVSGDYCYPPLIEVDKMCVYISKEVLSWADARQYCQNMAVQTSPPDLLVFDSCDDLVVIAGYLGLNVPSDSSFWVGGHTEFLGNNWRWVNGQPLSTGVPFWAHTEGHDKGEDCAAMDGKKYFKLADHNCEERRRFVCASPTSPEYRNNNANNTEVLDCPYSTVQVGNHCYYFSVRSHDWNHANEMCKSSDHHHHHHRSHGGQLFSPSSCDEFAHIAHYLEVQDYRHSYWVGAGDVTGNHEWYWLNGDLVPGGPPFWATEEPNHASTHARTQAAVMSPSKRYYLEDDAVYNYHNYICQMKPYD